MANTYTWRIERLDVVPKIDTLSDYVVVAYWRVVGTNNEGNYAQQYSFVEFSIDPTKTNYVPYDQLTETEVIQWVQSSLGNAKIDEIYGLIDADIQNQISPAVISPGLPWYPDNPPTP